MFKKIIIGCLITSVILTSCSKNTADTISAPKRLTKAEMYEQLKAINAVHTVRPEACSGFWKCLGNVLKIAGADITGAAAGVVAVGQAAAALGIATGGTGAVVTMCAGGAIAGAGASYKAATTMTAVVQPINDIYTGGITVNLPLEFNDFRQIGFKHNLSIYDVYFDGMEEPLIDQFYQGMLAVPSQYMPVLHSDIYLDAKHSAELLGRDYVFSNYDFAFLTSEAYNEGLITDDMRQILASFMQAYANSASNATIQSVINGYITTVNQSDLTTLERQALVASFVVASTSPFVFYNNVNEE